MLTALSLSTVAADVQRTNTTTLDGQFLRVKSGGRCFYTASADGGKPESRRVGCAETGVCGFRHRASTRYSSTHKIELGDVMVRRFLVAMAALALVVNGGARAQTTNATQPTASDPAAPDEVGAGQLCIAIREIHEQILVGRGGKGIGIELGGGACAPPGSGISDISVGFATPGGMEDFAECPAFQTRIAKLWAARPHTRHGYGTIPAVRAGPFSITDSSDLFQLQSPEGRRAAARWINQTLAAARPCWNKVRQDQTHYVIDLLYSDLRRSAPAAIDAAFAQDQRQEYRQLHALSPEAQAGLDENRQLRYLTSSRDHVSATLRERDRTAGRPWIDLKDFSVYKVDVASNGTAGSS
jgi:hypothetical protein